MFDKRGELPLLPFGNPIGFVLASRGEFYIKSSFKRDFLSFVSVRLLPDSEDEAWAMLKALKGYKVLEGVRSQGQGLAAVDVRMIRK